jgi:hypothetical protein
MSVTARQRPRPTGLRRVTDGRWLRVAFPTWTVSCCECHLVHRLDFRLFTDSRGKVVLLVRPTRARGLTRQRRRECRFTHNPTTR